jgi:FkbM family methyltransferase
MNPWDRDSFDWPLAGPVTVIEVGGYEGRWVSEMMLRYPGRYFAFEPQAWARERMAAKAAGIAGATLQIEPYGIGVTDGVFPMGGWGTDSCSFLKDDAFFARHDEGRNERGTGELVRADTALDRLGLDAVDVMMVNIEGYEFELLPYLIEREIMPRIRFLAVQFHGFADPRGECQNAIRQLLRLTHVLRFDWGDTLVGWERRA